MDLAAVFGYSLPSNIFIVSFVILPVPYVHSQNSCNSILLVRQRRPHRTKPLERHMNDIVRA